MTGEEINDLMQKMDTDEGREEIIELIEALNDTINEYSTCNAAYRATIRRKEEKLAELKELKARNEALAKANANQREQIRSWAKRVGELKGMLGKSGTGSDARRTILERIGDIATRIDAISADYEISVDMVITLVECETYDRARYREDV